MTNSSIWREMNIDKERVTEIMRLCGCKKKFYDKSASEYEMLCELLRIYPIIEGHKLREALIKELCRLLECDKSDLSLDPDNAANIWKKYNSKSGTQDYTGKENCIPLQEKTVKKYNLKNKTVVFVRNVPTFADGLDNDIKKVIDVIGKDGAVLCAELCSDSFLKPNPYAARKTYEKIKNNEKCNNEEKEALYYQILCEIYSDKKYNHIPLIIKVNGHVDCATKLLEYMHKYNMTPRTFVDVDILTQASDVLKLCRLSCEYALITPRVCATENNISQEVDDYIKQLAFCYPIGMIDLLYL